MINNTLQFLKKNQLPDEAHSSCLVEKILSITLPAPPPLIESFEEEEFILGSPQEENTCVHFNGKDRHDHPNQCDIPKEVNSLNEKVMIVSDNEKSPEYRFNCNTRRDGRRNQTTPGTV